MGLRANVLLCGVALSLSLALAACGSTAQNVKSVGAVPASGGTDVSLPTISIPDVTVPTISIPTISIPDITVPTITVPTITVPDGSTPQFTIPVNTASSTTADTTPATTAPASETAPPASDTPPLAGGTQTINADGISVQVPADWKPAGASSPAYSIPAAVGGGAPLLQYGSPAGDSLSVSSVAGTISLYKTVFASQDSLKTADVTIDGKAALQVTSSAETGLAFDFLFIQASSNKVFLVTFVGFSDGAQATEAAIFASIKVSS